MIVPRILRVLPAFIAAAIPMGCDSLLKNPDPPAAVTVDFLAPMGLRANALAPKAVVADPVRNRVFASCANSCAVSWT